MNLNSYTFILIIGVELDDLVCLRDLQVVDIAHALKLVTIKLMDFRNRIIFRDSCRSHLKLGDWVTRDTYSKHQNGLRNSLELLNISYVYISFCRALVYRQSENSLVKLILIVKEIENSPAKADKFIMRSSVRFWNLDLHY
jgi:hypothetical protein